MNSMLSFITWPYWLVLIIVLVLVVLVGGLIFLVWRRKRAEGVFSAVVSVSKGAQMPAGRLVATWRQFVSKIPRSMRNKALNVPLFLVIGDAGSGKTTLIDNHAGWKGQNFRFYPSMTEDPMLQIYLGAKVVAVELAASLLYNTNPAVHRALGKLWRHFPATPQIAVVIDAGMLLEPQPERLRQSGRALFGKLEVFKELGKAPIPLVLALSHMDKVSGFSEFCAFLQKAGIPLQIEFPSGDGISALESCLDAYSKHLDRALLTQSAQDYLKIVGFLRQAPGLLKVLRDFLRQERLAQGASSNPVMRLCLLSEQTDSFGCHPFLPLPGSGEGPAPEILTVHAKAAFALAAAGLVYLAGSYRYQQDIITDIIKRADIVNTTPVTEYAQKISPLFLDYSYDLNKDTLLSPLIPKYFDKTNGLINLKLIRAIRKNYLIPMLKEAQFDQDAPFKTNNLLALLYATPGNDVGRVFLYRIDTDPSEEMIKYKTLFRDYINHNSHTEEMNDTLNGLNYADQSQQLVEDITPWIIFFRDLQVAQAKPYIEELEFSDIKRKASDFIAIAHRSYVYRDQDMIVSWLQENTRLRRSLQTQYIAQSKLKQEGILKFLDLVKHLTMSDTDACQPAMSIAQCLLQIQAVAAIKSDEEPATMRFSLEGEDFSFDSGQWSDLMLRSRITLMLRNIVKSHRSADGWAFFDTPSSYADIELASAAENRLLPAATGHIDGRLSHDAFEQQVKPTVLALADTVSKLPVDKAEQKRFSDFVLRNLNAYSERYVNAYLNYLRQFRIEIDSVWSLQYELAQLQMPGSPLMTALLNIKQNTALSLPSTPAFTAFAQKLTAFTPIQRLMVEQNGNYPELAKYQLMMQQMQAELESGEPYTPKKTGDDAAGLKSALSPAGRLAWAMLLNDESSYLKLVKAWLQSAGIASAWQQPFLAPVQKVQELGAIEIAHSADGIWADIWNSNIAPMLSQYPFMPTSAVELTMDDLIKSLHPKQGAFWVSFNQYLAPLCSYSNGVWIKQHELTDVKALLPSNMLSRLNSVQQLTSNLWDAQGSPKALQFSVRPELLPTLDKNQFPGAAQPALNYLRSGGESALGFNQQAAWQKFALEWWNAPPASAGIELRKENSPERIYADITVGGESWSFFKLLQRGQTMGSNRYRWFLDHPDYPQQKLNLDFTFQADPWKLFTNLAGS
ncbi:hypothetical protein F6R98_00425 [Candidatus Methylospira mobilis]|uniref:IcmF-related N-terminal domain-containing protein n=1 Tax=Candidatus Methylospira mobilis TaxID=1808979 RepID=A0A5Q0BHG9_9GAMM|nr:hypothetical protein [Candidatus Methylospira mobilis]QFY41266.1 hypothetical protein F6R98_00425 [Candidatus Methylospira mobilis]WNV05512.1 hypothetical protein RP726_03620 [Candidatus Methylospira mobilis]